ncbi:hypothetical protein TRAPUB_5632 [Trametes pubescens]|uniref:Uncharacterized protein n=1 Tax=Trametes pubescens TaxID=154538 RepID=A0A1M2V815_TRAPU|nr:hypothetical protein TRAPUB_5632 [Trametes pubescens]
MPNQDDASSTNSQSPRSSTSTRATQSTPATSPDSQLAPLPQAQAPPPQFQGQAFPANFLDMASTPTTPRSPASTVNSPPAPLSPGLPSFLNLGSTPGSTPTMSPGVPGTPHGSPSFHNPAVGTGQGGARQGNPGR